MRMNKGQVLNHFDQIERSMLYDIDQSINAGTNFLTALGLVSYIEFFGGLITGEGGLQSKSRSNFYAAYNRLGESYNQFDKQMKSRFRTKTKQGKKRRSHDFYDIVRCGLVHEYFVKKDFVIAKEIVTPVDPTLPGDSELVWINPTADSHHGHFERVRRAKPGITWEGRKIVVGNLNLMNDVKNLCIIYRAELATSSEARKKFSAAFRGKKHLRP